MAKQQIFLRLYGKKKNISRMYKDKNKNWFHIIDYARNILVWFS